jgi:glycosyltransferase involved in cell wall biosynthesis
MDQAMLAAPGLRTPALDIRHLVIDEGGEHPSSANGLHHVARSLALEQWHAGDRPRIVVLTEAGGGVDVPPGIRSDVITLTGRKVLGRRIDLGQGVLARILEGVDASTIFHIHGARQPLLIPLTRALRKRGIPYVITLHSRFSHIYDRSGRVLKRSTALYVSLLEGPALNGARFIHTLTQQEVEELRRLAPRARSRLVPTGAYSSTLDGAPPTPARLRPSADFPVFGFCGRLAIHHKGLDLLVQGFAAYKRDGGPGKLVIVGTGSGREALADMCRTAGIADSASVEGPRFGAARNELVRQWDFFTIPSRLDHMPLAALEAALLGVPLMLTAETGLHQDMERYGAGLLIESLTPQGVAEAMRKAARLEAHRWISMSRGAHRMACSTADWTATADQLRLLYQTPDRPQGRRPRTRRIKNDGPVLQALSVRGARDARH